MGTKTRATGRNQSLKVTVVFSRDGLNVTEEHFYSGWCATAGFKALGELWPILNTHDNHDTVEKEGDIHLHDRS